MVDPLRHRQAKPRRQRLLRLRGYELRTVVEPDIVPTSTPEDAPRGMEFLYSPSRLNVATSRARCACLLVASPSLLEPDCRTPRQIQLANAFCRYLKLAKAIRMADWCRMMSEP